MNCTTVKEWLTEHLTAAGIEPTIEIARHLDTCDDCRRYYEDLVSVSETLLPLAGISMTAEESAKLETGIRRIISDGNRWSTYLRPERKIHVFIRTATAIAALILIVLISSGRQTTDEIAPTYSVDEFDLLYTATEDLAPLFVNGETDYLPALIDDAEAAYLTDRVYPAEAEEIMESVTTEEIEWLMENYSMEI
jgi:hypothetical protein